MDHVKMMIIYDHVCRDSVKNVMVQNIEKVLERGERIDILVDKTDTLNQASFAFKKRSTELRVFFYVSL
jgi:hypothetical protein